MPKYDTRQQKKHHVSSSPRQKYVTRLLGCAHTFQCEFRHVLVIFSHKYILSDRTILWAVEQPNFFVAKKSTLNGVRLPIISWQGYMDEDRTFYSVSENAILGGENV